MSPLVERIRRFGATAREFMENVAAMRALVRETSARSSRSENVHGPRRRRAAKPTRPS